MYRKRIKLYSYFKVKIEKYTVKWKIINLHNKAKKDLMLIHIINTTNDLIFKTRTILDSAPTEQHNSVFL